MKHLKQFLFINIILGFLALSFFNISIAKETDYSKIKKESYKTLAEALFSDDTYSKYRLEIVDTLGKLADPTDNSYSSNNIASSQAYNKVKSMLKSVTEKLNTVNESAGNKTDNDKTIKKVLEQGDLAIIQMLAELLNDNDFSIQLYAASSLINVDQDEAIEIFEQMLQSKENKNKIIALTVLPRLESSNTSETILQLINNESLPDKIRLNALNSLEKISPEKATTAAKTLVNSDILKLKAEACSFLTLQKDPEGTKEFIKLASSPITRRYALPELAKIISQLQNDSVDIIKELYSTDDNYVKFIVINYASKLKDFAPIKDLYVEALNSDELKIKLGAIGSLARIEDAQAVELLENLTFEEPELYQKLTGLYIQSDQEKNIEPMLELLNLNDPQIKLSIANYLIQKENHKEKGKELLTELLDDESESISLTAALLLIENDFDISDKIKDKLLNSTHSKIKAKTVLLLANKKDKSIIPYLKEAIKNNTNPQRAYGAALILYNLGNEDHLDLLIRYMSKSNISSINKEFINEDLFNSLCKHENDWVKLNAAQNLLENDFDGYIGIIKDLLNSKDVKLKSKAIKLIGEFGNIDDIKLLEDFLNDEYVRVRVNSSEAILRIIHREENNTRSS